MKFDYNREQRFAQMRLKQNLDRDVDAAMRRVRQYTATELEEVRLGKRESLRDRDMRLAREAFQQWATAMGQAADVILKGLAQVGKAIDEAMDRMGEKS